MKHINTYANISEYNADTNRDPYNSVSYIKDEDRVEYNFMIEFADPEVGRVLHANRLIKSPVKSSKRELATIRSLNPHNSENGSYFFNNYRITQFPELKYFTGLTSLYNVFYNCSSLTTVGDIPEGITDMYQTFIDCTSLLEAPDIPEGVINMESTFRGCTSLTTAPPKIPSSVTNLYNTFWLCSSLTTAPVLSEGITALRDTFNGCSSLLEAPDIPSSVNDLRYTFRNCSSITTAPVLPSSVTRKNLMGTFDGCSSLLEAPDIPSSVTNLSATFRNCSSIDGIYVINIRYPVYYVNSLSNVQAIYVPDASVSAYKSASGWIEFADKIYPMSDKP